MLFLIIAGMMIVNSCQKESVFSDISPIQIEEGITVQEGILNFESVEAYSNTIKSLSTMSESDLNRWEKALNYSSLRYNKVLRIMLNWLKKLGRPFQHCLTLVMKL